MSGNNLKVYSLVVAALQFGSVAVIGSLQSAHRQVYSHHKPLCFLASRDLTIKTINFFSFDEAEKVEDEVDVASGRCRRKNYPFIFCKTL